MADQKFPPPTLPPRGSQQPKKKMSGCVIALIVCAILAAVSIPLIGILAGLLFPATSGVLRKVKMTHAENDAYNLKNAVAAYFTEYRKYPVKNPQGDSTVRSEGELMAILFAYDSEGGPNGMNPRHVVFFSGKQAKPTGDGGWRKGVNLDENNPGLYDPWGSPYWVKIDTDYDNKLSGIGSFGELEESIAVWSAGRDGYPDTWEDNVKTW